MRAIEIELSDHIFIEIETRKTSILYPAFTKHNAYEIYILKTGRRNIFIGNSLYETCPGDAAMIPINEAHRSFGDTPYSGICIEFSKECLKKNFEPRQRELILSAFQKPIISLPKEALCNIWNKAEQMEHGDEEKKALILEIAVALNKYLPDTDIQKKRTNETDLSPIGSYIQRNYMSIKGLDDLEAHFGMTKSYLCRVFKKQTGITIIHYINSLRIQHACKLLEETDLPIQEISKMCGFETVIYFNRIFRRIKEETPRNMRKRAQASQMYIQKN